MQGLQNNNNARRYVDAASPNNNSSEQAQCEGTSTSPSGLQETEQREECGGQSPRLGSNQEQPEVKLYSFYYCIRTYARLFNSQRTKIRNKAQNLNAANMAREKVIVDTPC